MNYLTVSPPCITSGKLPHLSWKAVNYPGLGLDTICFFTGSPEDCAFKSFITPVALSLACPAKISKPVKNNPITEPMTGHIILRI